MARWRLISQVFGEAPGFQPQVWGVNTIIASDPLSAEPGDLIWPKLAERPTWALRPLDASALALTQRATPLTDNNLWPREIGP